jgi:hypothetical protein
VGLSHPSLGETLPRWRAAAGARVRHWRRTTCTSQLRRARSSDACAATALTPRRMGRARGSPHTSGAKAVAHAPPGGGVSRGRARVKAGDACGVLQMPRRLKWQRLRAAGDAMVPVAMTGTRDCEHRSRARTPRRSRYPEVAPGVAIPRQAQDRYAAPDALASATEATKRSCSVSLEEPDVRVKHETPGHPSRGVC